MSHHVQVSTKLFDQLITRSTAAYERGKQPGPTKKVVLTGCKMVAGVGPPMAFVEHCLGRCAHLEVIEATGFGGISGAFHINDLLMLLRTLNKMRPAPQVLGDQARSSSTPVLTELQAVLEVLWHAISSCMFGSQA